MAMIASNQDSQRQFSTIIRPSKQDSTIKLDAVEPPKEIVGQLSSAVSSQSIRFHQNRYGFKVEVSDVNFHRPDVKTAGEKIGQNGAKEEKSSEGFKVNFDEIEEMFNRLKTLPSNSCHQYTVSSMDKVLASSQYLGRRSPRSGSSVEQSETEDPENDMAAFKVNNKGRLALGLRKRRVTQLRKTERVKKSSISPDTSNNGRSNFRSYFKVELQKNTYLEKKFRNDPLPGRRSTHQNSIPPTILKEALMKMILQDTSIPEAFGELPQFDSSILARIVRIRYKHSDYHMVTNLFKWVSPQNNKTYFRLAADKKLKLEVWPLLIETIRLRYNLKSSDKEEKVIELFRNFHLDCCKGSLLKVYRSLFKDTDEEEEEVTLLANLFAETLEFPQ